MACRDFLQHQFGIEVELTGITRTTAAEVIAKHLHGTVERTFDRYDTHQITAEDQRVWSVVYDGSIHCQRQTAGTKQPADSEYSVELVSPILTYDKDIQTLQEILRKLRKAGAFADNENCCGIHVHLDGAPHTARSLRNFINIIHSRNDLLYEALQIAPKRMRYCKKLELGLVNRMNTAKPRTLQHVERIWYEGYHEIRTRRYHSSRHHFVQLHGLFNGVGTVELRGFNNENLHAGKVRAYIVLALAMNHQALHQKSARSEKPQMDNPKFAMRTWLNRIGLIGDEFKHCREHLVKHLPGSASWRFRQAG